MRGWMCESGPQIHWMKTEIPTFDQLFEPIIVPEVEDSIRRVADRVQVGGHNVPEPDLGRRFRVGLQNLFSLYRPLLNSWALYDNSEQRPRKLAQGDPQNHVIFNPALFEKIAADFNVNL